MTADFAPVQGDYSDGFKAAISAMLSRDPEQRPSCQQLLDLPLFSSIDTNARPLSRHSSRNRSLPSSQRKHMQSVIFHWTTNDMSPIHIEFGRRFKITSVACGQKHCLALNDLAQVFAWGESTYGQLGTGNTQSHIQPTLISALSNSNVVQVAAGGHGSAFLASTGVISTCGRADDGMLGHAGQIPLLSPQGIQSLIGSHVRRIAVGHKHMAAITDTNELFTWGSNASRQLGAPDIEVRSAVPVHITLASGLELADVYCGPDATAVVTKDSRLLACGSNAYNKLGLNPRFGLLSRRQVDKAERFMTVKINNKGLVEDVSLGTYCTSLVMNTGKVYVLGSNQYGSLGTGRA